MLSKKVVKDIQSLSEKKFRRERGVFVAEGPKTVNEILEQIPDHVEALYATSDWALLKRFPDTIVISADELKKISSLTTPNQVLAVVKQLQTKPPVADKLVLYLDAIQDPGNLGTIIRIADWFGIADIVCSEGCADVYSHKVVQSTMASIVRVNVFYDNQLTWIGAQQSNIFATALNGIPVKDVGTISSGVLIIGNESKGVRPELLEMATDKITIPKYGGAESLNAAVATGIVLSHII